MAFKHEKCRRRLALSLMTLIFAGCASSHSTVYDMPGHPKPQPYMQIGLCEDYPEESRSLDGVEKDLGLLESLGVTQLRICLGWDGIESSPGQYDWSFWDAFFDAADRHHVTLRPYVCYTPRWNSTGNADNFWKSPPKDDEAFGRFVGAAATRYRGRAQSWELWNEPDNADFWTGTIDQYAKLVKAGAAAVKKADPQAQIVLGGMAGNTDFAEKLMADDDINGLVFTVNLHAYFETWNGNPIEQIPRYVNDLERPLRKNGAITFWMAEVGYSDHRRGDKVSGDYTARFNYEHTAAFQADALWRMAALALSTENVQFFAWYRIHDLPEKQDVIGDTNNRHLGILNLAGEPKPAAGALANVVKLLGKVSRCADRGVRVEREINSDAQVHAFFTVDKRIILVAWLATVTPDTAQGDDRAIDARQSAVKLTLDGPYKVTSAMTATGPLPAPPTARYLDTTTLTLPMTGGVTYIIELSPE